MTPRARLALPLLLAAACAAPPAPDDLPLLTAGTTRLLRPGETVHYRVPLAAGDVLRLEIEQDGVDVVARLLDPAGAVLLTADRSIHDEGVELVAAVAATSGDHAIELEAWDRLGPHGRIAVGRLVRRPADDGDRRHAVLFGDFRAAVARERDDPADAIATYERIVADAAAAGEPELAAEAAVRVGTVLYRGGRWAEAVDAFARAVDRSPAGGFWRLLALELLGTSLLAVHEPARAVEPLEAALELAEGHGYRFRRARCHSHLGDAYGSLGAIQKAIEHLQRARRLHQPWEAKDQAKLHHDLGSLYHWNLGQPRLALEAFAEARRIYDPSGDRGRQDLAALLNQMGAAHETQGETAAAVARYEEALELRRDADARCAAANTLSRLALLGSHPGPAGDHADEARRTLAVEPCPRDRGAVRLRLGLLEERAGRLRLAREEYRQSLSAYRDRGDRTGEGRALLGTIRVCRRLGDCETPPLTLARRALAIFESTRSELLREEHRVAYGSHTHELFDLLIDLEWSHRLFRDAFASAERARGRAFHDRLRDAGAETPPPPEEPTALDEVRRRLDPSSVLLAYRLGAARSFLWVVTTESEETLELPPRGEVETAATAVRALLVSPEPFPGGPGWRPDPFRRLADQILPASLTPTLADRRLLVVADGALELVPFAALPDADGRPLVERHEIVHLPSATVWAALRDRPPAPVPGGAIAVVADPVYEPADPRLGNRGSGRPPPHEATTGLRSADDGVLSRLAGAGREASEILAAAPDPAATRMLSGPEATKAAVLGGALRGYRYVHFATHGVVQPLQPAYSYLGLSRFDAGGKAIDGDLHAYELYGLDLPTELVVLAGCETGVGPLIPGEGLVSGLARGFLHAGARRVIVSLWPVSDRATPELMRRFYARLFATGAPALSLHVAQRELFREGRHPYDWAGFVIQGD